MSSTNHIFVIYPLSSRTCPDQDIFTVVYGNVIRRAKIYYTGDNAHTCVRRSSYTVDRVKRSGRFRAVSLCKTRGGRAPARLTGKGKTMERVTLRIPKQQIEAVEQLVETGEFPNRSEAIRSAVRDMINEENAERQRRDNKRPWARA